MLIWIMWSALVLLIAVVAGILVTGIAGSKKVADAVEEEQPEDRERSLRDRSAS